MATFGGRGIAAPVFQSSDSNDGQQDNLPTLASVTPDGGSDRMAIVVFSWEHGGAGQDVASVTWNGKSLTKLGTGYNPSNAATHNAVSVWYLLDTDFPASAGSVTFTVDDSRLNDIWIAMGQFTGAKQQAPDTLQIGTSATSPVSVDILTIVADSILVEVASNGASDPFTANDGQTVRETLDDASTGHVFGTQAAPTVQTYSEGWANVSTTRLVTGATAIQPLATDELEWFQPLSQHKALPPWMYPEAWVTDQETLGVAAAAAEIGADRTINIIGEGRTVTIVGESRTIPADGNT